MRGVAALRRGIHRLLAPIIYRDGVAVVPPKVGPVWGERQFLRRLLKGLKVDCVFDVGANEGQYASELRLIGYRGTIVSFEPSPRSFERLSEVSEKDPDWHVFDFALGSVAGGGKLRESCRAVAEAEYGLATQAHRYRAIFAELLAA